MNHLINGLICNIHKVQNIWNLLSNVMLDGEICKMYYYSIGKSTSGIRLEMDWVCSSGDTTRRLGTTNRSRIRIPVQKKLARAGGIVDHVKFSSNIEQFGYFFLYYMMPLLECKKVTTIYSSSIGRTDRQMVGTGTC